MIQTSGLRVVVRGDDGQAMEIEIGGITFTPGTYRSDSAINFAYGTVVTLDDLNEPLPVFSSKLKAPWLPLRTPILS